MPYSPPTVNYSTAVNGTYTTLTGVQSVAISRGRQRFQDPYPQTSCTVELIPATTYATPLAIGQYLDIRASNSGTAVCYFQGRITDVQRSYAMPYNSGTGYAPADRIVVTATGGVGVLGTYQFANFSQPSQKASYYVDNVCYYGSVNNIGITPITPTANDLSPVLAATTFSGSALDLMNIVLRSLVGSIDDVANRTSTWLTVNPTTQIGNTPFTFADTGAVGTRKFNNLEFLSSVQNTFNQVNVESPAVATQSASGTAPYNSLNYGTLNSTTDQSSSQAGYLYNLLSGQVTACPYVIGVNDKVDDGIVEALLRMYNVEEASPQSVLQSRATVTFRGTTSEGIIQGVSAFFTQENATGQVYLSPSLGQPFILDSTSFGVLDTNRLGYP